MKESITGRVILVEMKIWFISCASLYRALCDTKDCGKLSKEQFALAFYLINQKLTKGIDPPQALTPEMIPPSDRSVTLQKVRMGLHAWYKFQRLHGRRFKYWQSLSLS